MLGDHSLEKFQDGRRLHPLSLKSVSDELVDFSVNCSAFVQEVLYLALVSHASRQIRRLFATALLLIRLLWRSKPVIDLEQVCEEQCFNALLVKKIENGSHAAATLLLSAAILH